MSVIPGTCGYNFIQRRFQALRVLGDDDEVSLQGLRRPCNFFVPIRRCISGTYPDGMEARVGE